MDCRETRRSSERASTGTVSLGLVCVRVWKLELFRDPLTQHEFGKNHASVKIPKFPVQFILRDDGI